VPNILPSEKSRTDPAAIDRNCEDDVSAAARNLAGEGGAGGRRLALHHLLGAAGSSPAAAVPAVARFAARRPDDPAWQALAHRWAALGRGGKETALLDLLRRNPAEKKLVFVHSRETLSRLADLLAENDISFALVPRKLSRAEPLGEQAAHSLRMALRRGALQPGQRLTTREVAATLGGPESADLHRAPRRWRPQSPETACRAFRRGKSSQAVGP
jgi:hypothetical protein